MAVVTQITLHYYVYAPFLICMYVFHVIFFLRYQVVRKCWHIEPTQRWTFEDIVDKIEAFLENKGEYVTFPVNEDYYKFFPKKETDSSKGPTPPTRKEDKYLEPIDNHGDFGFVLNCGIDAFRKVDT